MIQEVYSGERSTHAPVITNNKLNVLLTDHILRLACNLFSTFLETHENIATHVLNRFINFRLYVFFNCSSS